MPTFACWQRSRRSGATEAQVSILRTADVLHRAVGEMFKPFDLSSTQYNVLRILRGTCPSGTSGLPCNAIANQMLNQPGGITAQATPAAGGPPAAAASGIPETFGPADAAKILGVSEADVIASLNAGDLKGRKIGTQWRITKTAIADFLK